MINPDLDNFMRADVLEASRAVVVFTIYLFFPGYVIGCAGNLLSFRKRSASERWLLSIVLSLAASPLMAVLIGRFVSITASQWFFLVTTLIAGILIATELISHGHTVNFRVKRSTWAVLGIALLWSVVALFELADLQLGHRLYLSVTAFDHCIRNSIVQAAARTGVPPLNPLFSVAGQSPVMRYYYYWYVLCALPSQLAGLPARACLTASSVWCGFALIALIPLYLKHFLEEKENLRRKSVLGIALLAATGLDLIPTALWALRRPSVVLSDMEWWDPPQVTSWVGSVLWVPHHVAALIAFMVGFLLLSNIDEEMNFAKRTTAAIFAAIAFASAAGLSVYVTFAGAMAVCIWTLVLLAQRKFSAFAAFAGSGAITLFLSWPYLRDLQGPSNSGQGFAIFAIREFPTALVWLKHHNVTDPFLIKLSAIPTVPVVYAIEFGFFLIVGVLRFKNELRGPARVSANQRAAWVILGASLFIATFMQSGVISTNDLGIRSSLLAQFMLLLWGAPLVSDLLGGIKGRSGLNRPGMIIKWFAVGTLALGTMGSAYELMMLRSYAPLVDGGHLARTENFMPSTPSMGDRTYALRAGYQQLNKTISTKAVVQHNPETPGYVAHLLYSGHQAAAGGLDCGSAFGGDPQKCEEIVKPLSALFDAPEYTSNWDIDELCSQYSIDVLVVTDTDRAWYDASGWVWNRRAYVANDYMRAVPCGKYSRGDER